MHSIRCVKPLTYLFAQCSLLKVQQLHQQKDQCFAIILCIWHLLLQSSYQRLQLLEVIIILQP